VDWAERLELVSSGPQREKLSLARVARLEALVFHDASQAVLQLAADWTTLFCLLDDHVERDGLGPIELSAYLAQLLSGFRQGAMTPSDPLANAFADLRARMLALAGAGWLSRFAAHLEDLFCGYLWEEINRRKKLRPSPPSYRTMRVDTIGLRPQFLFGELAMGIELPPPLRRDPDLVDLEVITSRAVGWANDIFTCSKELASGEVHNLVLVLMDHEQLSLADAIRRAAAAHDEEVRSFLSIASALREPVGAVSVRSRYVHMLQRWIRGHLDWSSETGRYSKQLSVPQP
jgi:5-epi-alpha-selinene synthase